MKLRPLINKYEKDCRVALKKLLSRGFDYNFSESIRLMENDSDNISREIIRELADNNVCKGTSRLLG
jgi:hypothetical protein